MKKKNKNKKSATNKKQPFSPPVHNKIAIVYLREKDKEEYLEYIRLMIHKGYISPEIEDLELQKLQGAEGLRALRVTCIPPESDEG